MVAIRELLLLPLDDLNGRGSGNSSSPVSAVSGWIAASAVTVVRTQDLATGAGWRQGLTIPPSGSRPTRTGFVHIDVKYLPKMQDEASRKLSVRGHRPGHSLGVPGDPQGQDAPSLIRPKSLKALLKKAPFKIRKILTDNEKEFTDRFRLRENASPPAIILSTRCARFAHIEHRLIPPRHPHDQRHGGALLGRIAENLRKRALRLLGGRNKPWKITNGPTITRSPNVPWAMLVPSRSRNGRKNALIYS